MGLYLRACLENLQLELGVSRCPLEYDYDVWGALATNWWVEALWERIHRFKIKIDIDYEALLMPRERGECIMERFVREKVPRKELIGINRVRKHQHALFLSDIVSTNGCRIEPMYLSWPSESDFESWDRAFNTSTLGSMALANRLGNWLAALP